MHFVWPFYGHHQKRIKILLRQPPFLLPLSPFINIATAWIWAPMASSLPGALCPGVLNIKSTTTATATPTTKGAGVCVGVWVGGLWFLVQAARAASQPVRATGKQFKPLYQVRQPTYLPCPNPVQPSPSLQPDRFVLLFATDKNAVS